jgi:hypothetical protein
LLIVRDMMFKERRTYKEFLSGEEGIASNILLTACSGLNLQES